MIDIPSRLQGALKDRYRIERKLGEGGMATVYLAEDLRHERRVALKVLKPEVASVVGAERFLAEIKTTANLQHPNILPLFDSGEVGGLLYYVMPFVEGESLQARLRREGPLPVDEACRILGDLAVALDHAHEEGIVHRDVKPGNILLSHGKALVADFGIALGRVPDTGERITELGMTPGTAAYMSPEQAAGEEVDIRSDVYSLGCVAYELLTGRPPFEGANDLVVQLRHATEKVAGLRELRPEIPEAVADAVQAALEKDRERRPRTASDFVRGLGEPARAPALPVRLGWVAALVVAAGFVGWLLLAPPRLEGNRVLIFPLVVSGEVVASSTLGEDVATVVGHALDGVGPLRWVDGWTLLDADQRGDIRTLELQEARRIAADRGSAYFVTGRILGGRADSVEVFLDLTAAGNGEVVERGRGVGPAREAWRAGLAAAVDLLPTLVPGVDTRAVAEWRDRDPLAITSFLLGEAAFRRVHLEEALVHYRSAVAQDSTFALAALRGSQAASWNHRPGEASSLTSVALRSPLPDHLAFFARGLDHYLAGRADSAAAQLRMALAVDPEMTVGWMQLGEVYRHLLPLAGRPDSLSAEAFREAMRLDTTAAILLLHPLESRLRWGDLRAAEPMLERFLSGSPDPVIAGKLEIMAGCHREGPGDFAWTATAQERPLSLLTASYLMVTAPPGVPCARRGLEALLEVDTAATPAADGRRWVALLASFAGSLARGDVAGAMETADRFTERWGFGSTVYLLGAPVEEALLDRAREVADADGARWGRDYAGVPFPRRLWELGVLEAVHGEVAVAESVAGNLAQQARESGNDYIVGLARSMEALVLLAHGDTAAALDGLTRLVPDARVLGELSWDEAEPRGLERLTLARLHLARGDPERALEIASVFDSPWPLIHGLYLPASLELRARAAEALGDEALAAHYRDRRAAFRAPAEVGPRQ